MRAETPHGGKTRSRTGRLREKRGGCDKTTPRRAKDIAMIENAICGMTDGGSTGSNKGRMNNHDEDDDHDFADDDDDEDGDNEDDGGDGGDHVRQATTFKAPKYLARHATHSCSGKHAEQKTNS